MGYPEITDSSILVGLNNSKGVSGISTSVALTVSSGSTAQVNYLGNAVVSGLVQSASYRFYTVSSGNLGTSPIQSIVFNTTTLSNGAQMSLKFTDIVSPL